MYAFILPKVKISANVKLKSENNTPPCKKIPASYTDCIL